MFPSQTIEQFPALTDPPSNDQPATDFDPQQDHNSMARPRRKSSGLMGDPRGDTGAPAVSTLEPMPTIASPPLSPVSYYETSLVPELIDTAPIPRLDSSTLEA